MRARRGTPRPRWSAGAVVAALTVALPVTAALTPMSQVAAQETVAITGARIHTGAGPVIESGTVVVRDGRIAAVGADVRAPAGARVIDGTGKVVTAGFLDSFTQLGVVEIGAVEGTVDNTSENDRYTAAFSVKWGLNPLSSLIPIARTGGITRAVVAPSPGASIIAGQGVLIDLAGDRVDELLQRDPVAMYAIQDERAAGMSGGSRGTSMLRIREALQDAADYAENRNAYEGGDRRRYALSRLDLEALVPVVRGEMRLALRVARAADILTALELREEYGLDMVLLGAAEGWAVADDIARSGVTVVVNPMENIQGFDALLTTLENAARLDRAGVNVVFASFDAHNVRNLRQAAGNAVAYGMPWESALRAVTSAPAALWGVDDEFGTVQPGMDADLVVWSGDPFELLTVAERVFVEGEEMPTDTRQTELLERYLRIGEGGLPQSYRNR